MRENSSFNTVEALVVLVAAAVAAYLLLPHFKKVSDKERVVMQSAIIINTAIKDYGTKHSGNFPAIEEIRGGDGKDELIKGSMLIYYPVNPYSKKGERMKRVPVGEKSPGDFSYYRDPELRHEYELRVYGENGRVYKYSKSIMN